MVHNSISSAVRHRAMANKLHNASLDSSRAHTLQFVTGSIMNCYSQWGTKRSHLDHHGGGRELPFAWASVSSPIDDCTKECK